MAAEVDAPHPYTLTDDLGRAMVMLGARDEALGRAWHVPNAQTLSARKFLDLLFQQIGKPPRMSVVSRPIMVLAGLFIPGAGETVEMLYEFE